MISTSITGTPIAAGVFEGRRVEVTPGPRNWARVDTSPTHTTTYERRPNGGWRSWYASDYGNGYFLPSDAQRDASLGLATLLDVLAKEIDAIS